MSVNALNVVRDEFSLRTKAGEWYAVDITENVAGLVGVRDGFALVHTPHTSAAILVGESGERLLADYRRVGQAMLAAGRPYLHSSHGHLSGEAHVFCFLHGPQALLPIADGSLALSPLQRVFFVDPTQGPRDRTVWVYSFGPVVPHRLVARN
ncbi:MAG: YjbQ family protein [Propionibacteriaceae bacterium]|jgi:thiamine phosphate synthase YjbQ (UPF0047 family)|nr:YjbQ family protein [Propionibacteriaceae bacterium]